VVTDDEIRSLAISQRLLGTEEIVLIHHTDCGMLTSPTTTSGARSSRTPGTRPVWAAEAFDDLDEDVRQSVARIKASPFIPRKDAIRGFVYEVETGACAKWPDRAGGTRSAVCKESCRRAICKKSCRWEESALIERRPPNRRSSVGRRTGEPKRPYGRRGESLR
jgi:hypothetical protein